MSGFGLPILGWSSECDELRILSASETVEIEMSVIAGLGIEVLHRQAEYVAVNGVITISGLQEMLNRYCLLNYNMLDDMSKAGLMPKCTFKWRVVGDAWQETLVVYNRRKMSFPLIGDNLFFGVQDRQRKVRVGQSIPLYYWVSFGAVSVGLAYVNKAGVVSYAEKQLPDNSEGMWAKLDASVGGAVSYVLGGWDDVWRVLYYDFQLQDSEKIYDRVRCEVEYDNLSAPHILEVMFLNMFGVYETLLMTGSDTESVELESSTGYANGKLIRTDGVLQVLHEMHSGWLSRARYATVIDMCESPWVAVKAADGSWREIVVTKLKAERVRPNNMPDDVVVSWRYAERIGQMRAVFEPVNPAADDVFDYSFDRVFD